MSSRYQITTPPVPQDKRAVVNRGILNLIESGQRPDREKVYAAYTGVGGLHGLKRGRFRNRHAYSEAKREYENGQFFTPAPTARLVVGLLQPEGGSRVLDLGCGAGAFFNFLDGCALLGCDTDAQAISVTRYLYPEADVVCDDMRSYQCAPVDYVVGNPPFALRLVSRDCPLRNQEGEVSSEDLYLWSVSRLLVAGGAAAFVVPANWMQDPMRYAKARTFLSERFWMVGEIRLAPDLFRYHGCENVSTKIVVLQGKLPGERIDEKPVVLDGSAMLVDEVLEQWRHQAAPFLARKAGILRKKARLTFEQSANLGSEAPEDAYRFRKLVYHLSILDKDAAAKYWQRWSEVHRPKPPEIDYESWEATRIKPATVLREMKKILRRQHVKAEDRLALVRVKHGFKIKSYSRRASAVLRKVAHFWSDRELIDGKAIDLGTLRKALKAAQRKDKEPLRFSALNHQRVIARKRRRRDLWIQALAQVEQPRLRAAARRFYSSLANHGIAPVELQISEIARFGAKPGAILAWEMGVGKTLASLAWDQIKRAELTRPGGTLIVSSALSIEMNWELVLNKLGFAFERPTCRAGWLSTGHGLVLATHHQIIKYKRILMRLAKQKRLRRLILDEGDEIGSRTSQLSRAVLAVGLRLRNRLDATGTVVRNSCAELYNQLELIMGGEPAFTCQAPVLYEFDRESGEFIETDNPDCGARYPIFRGYSLFRNCHSPRKPTVLGVQRSVPLLPNRVELSRFLSGVRSRLELKTVLGREVSRFETRTTELTEQERALYDKIVENARLFIREELARDRRCSLLLIAQTLRMLQECVSIPEKHDAGISGVPGKRRLIGDLSRSLAASHVAIGVLWRNGVNRTADYLRQLGGRDVFEFNGEVSFKQRLRILEQFKASPRAALVSTQGALRSSVSLPIVQHVVVESLPWNLSRLNQFVFRFIRLTNKEPVPVTLVVARDTIEERILGLLLRKEGIAKTVAGDVFAGEEELFSIYGINSVHLEELLAYLNGEAAQSLKVAPKR